MTKRLVMRGLFPATATPFREDESLSIDFEALEQHLSRTAQAEGVSGIVVNGHAGEILALTSEERAQVVQVAARVKQPGQIVVAGIESHTISGAVREGLNAKRAGADALLVLPPFDIRPYRRLTRFVEPVVQFFGALDQQVDLPMVVFAYADGSGCAYPVSVLEALADIPNVVAVKAASGTVTRYTEVWEALNDRLSILAACDAPELLGMLLHGAHGALIGISAVEPAQWSRMVSAALNGDAERAREIFNRFCIPLMSALFENQEPKEPFGYLPCVKEALVQLGQFRSTRVRPLAVDITEVGRERVRRGLKAAGLLEPALV